MSEVKFICIDPNLTIKYGKTNPKKKVSFNNGVLITSNTEEIDAVRELIERNIIYGIKEIKFEEAPKKNETKKENKSSDVLKNTKNEETQKSNLKINLK